MHVETYLAFLTPRDKKPSLSSSEEKSSEFDWLERKRMRKQKYVGKTEQGSVYSIYDQYYGLHIWSSSFLQWMQGSLYRKVIYPSLDTF